MMDLIQIPCTHCSTAKLGYNELGYNEQKNYLVGLGHFYDEFSRL